MMIPQFVLAGLALVSVASATSPTCNRDNCLRAIIASSNPSISGVADCQSVLTATFTPATKTYTSTITVGPGPIIRAGVAEREANANVARDAACTPAFPTYASSCSSVARYISACSCVGVTPGITTAPTPSTTVTVTVTAAPS
ncbi:hypothetical protein VTK73DRAFT_5560 [Phialemonium thermophilum]|uniref:Antifreeze protein n=1 Tax=Phialemonium thermophilum TaxID=223376 RepID=A0ABR3XX22_9PEZI